WEHGFAAANFGPALAADIAGVLHDYGRLQSRRKPELLNRLITLQPDGTIGYDDQATPFSLVNYGELDRVTAEWQDLAARASRISARLPAAYRDAYYELVGYAVT